MTGIIVEIKGKKMLVMNDKGDFKKLKYREGYDIGQEIDLTGHIGIYGTTPMQRAFALIVFFIVIIVVGIYTYYTPYSYVNIDIKPSIEIVLNRYKKVLDVQGINEEGQIIVESKGDFMHNDVGNTVSWFIGQAYELNYLNRDEEKEIIITIYAPKSRMIDRIGDVVREYANKELDNKNIISNIFIEGVTEY